MKDKSILLPFIILYFLGLGTASAEPDGAYDPNVSHQAAVAGQDKKTPESRVKMSGRYRLAFGENFEDFIINDSNADLQERNFRYLFGERLNNTYDPALYSQYLLNVDFSPEDKFHVHTQLVADPWSWVGTTGFHTVTDRSGVSRTDVNLKYFGAMNSVINEIYRTNTGESFATPVTKVHGGQTSPFTATGFYTPFPGIYDIPALDVDFEFRPIRKLWLDYAEENWHARVFVLADQNQALSTDDPLQLSNHKNFWQVSPWLDQYNPIQFFSDSSVKRGYYSDALPFLATDSEGNRLVLLRGASLEADLDKTYMAATVAAPFTPWDEDYFKANNVPGVVRIKHQATDALTLGGTYTFRTGLVDSSVADFNQVLGVDSKYKLNDHVKLTAEVAGSHRDQDLLTSDTTRTHSEGYAYKAGTQADFDHRFDGHTDFEFTFTQMDRQFNPSLSRYFSTRDDPFWGTHISFVKYSPNLEHFRIGDGVDLNRFVFRLNWKEKLFKDRFENLIDLRNVHRTENTAYIETVARDELIYRVNSRLTAKGLFRWQGLPKTTPYVEPFLANYRYSGDLIDVTSQNVSLQNIAIPADKDASRFTYSGGLHYIFNQQWTAEGILERSNDIPDFPRGLLFNVFRDPPDRVDGVLIDRLQGFLYGQTPFGLPPFKYFNIVKERLIYKPDPKVTVTLHSTQNSYKFAGGIDDNINHQGVGIGFDVSNKLSLFLDCTHSMQIDVPQLIATDYTISDYSDHYNFYASLDYKMAPAAVLRLEYGVFGLGANSPQVSPYSTTGFSLPTIDTEHLLRVSLSGEF